MIDLLEELRDDDPILATELNDIHTLERLMDWFQIRRLPLSELDLIAQDEYSHDLIIPLSDGRWMSFAVT